MTIKNEVNSKHLNLILQAIKVLTDRTASLTERLDKSLKMILEGIRANNGSIMIANEQGTELTVLASTKKHIINKKQPVNPKSISGKSFLSQKPVFIQDIHQDPDFAPKARPENYLTSSLMSIPLISVGDNSSYGVVNASDRHDNTCFEPGDLELLMDYSTWISPILQNSFLMDVLSQEKDRYKALSSELELKQKQLMTANAQRSELVQMVVHDFKSPLSAVISNLELLSYIGMTEEQKPVVSTAQDGSQKLLEMINDFLELARADEFMESTEFQDISLKEVALKEVDIARPVAKAKNISLELISDKDVIVWGQKKMIHHLVSNYISNALKYTPENGSVKMSWKLKKSTRLTDKYPGVVTFCVEDNGEGVPDDMKQSVFDKFFRMKKDVKIQGTGVGLYICGRIADMLGGKVWVEDANPCGSGSRFCATMFSRKDNDAQQ